MRMIRVEGAQEKLPPKQLNIPPKILTEYPQWHLMY
jgi:hypothetical protein